MERAARVTSRRRGTGAGTRAESPTRPRSQAAIGRPRSRCRASRRARRSRLASSRTPETDEDGRSGGPGPPGASRGPARCGRRPGPADSPRWMRAAVSYSSSASDRTPRTVVRGAGERPDSSSRPGRRGRRTGRLGRGRGALGLPQEELEPDQMRRPGSRRRAGSCGRGRGAIRPSHARASPPSPARPARRSTRSRRPDGLETSTPAAAQTVTTTGTWPRPTTGSGIGCGERSGGPRGRVGPPDQRHAAERVLSQGDLPAPGPGVQGPRGRAVHRRPERRRPGGKLHAQGTAPNGRPTS